MPSTGDTLLLGDLGRSVGANGDSISFTKLAADGRGSAATTKLSEFYISAISTMTTPSTEPAEASTATATVSFSNAGSLYLTRIANQNANFLWTEGLNDGFFVLTIASDYTASISYNNVGSDLNISFSVRVKDFFNQHATNYNTTVTRNEQIQNAGGGAG